MPDPSLPSLIRFGSFELDPATGIWREIDEKVRLPGQQFQNLQMLLRRGPRVWSLRRPEKSHVIARWEYRGLGMGLGYIAEYLKLNRPVALRFDPFSTAPKRAGGWNPGLYLEIENAPYMALVIEATDESGPSGLPQFR